MKSTRHKHIKIAKQRERARLLKMYREQYTDDEGNFYHPRCTGCDELLDLSDEYSMRYGFCCVTCGLHTVGMSWSDFY